MFVQSLRQLLVANPCSLQFRLEEATCLISPLSLTLSQPHICAPADNSAEYGRFLLTTQHQICTVCDRKLSQIADVPTLPPLQPRKVAHVSVRDADER